jgi:hypothetical protein
MLVRESQIEDVLATYPPITQKVLGIGTELNLLARQKSLESGRLDLLFASEDKLLLLELKAENFKTEFVNQVEAYRSDLLSLQAAGLLLGGLIEAFLLCPVFTSDGLDLCKGHNIIPVEYSPMEVLQEFFIRLRSYSPFVALRPVDSGLWNIYLINRVLYALAETSDIEEVAVKTDLSIRTVGNHLRFAEQLHLVERNPRGAFLTTLGKQYVVNRDKSHSADIVTEEQATVIRDFILENPFASPTIFGIYQIVETTFTLSRNVYPVPLDMIIPHFRDASGKRFEWQTDKSAYHGTRMYSNYAIELGLLAKVGDKLLVTPSGIRFTLLLQLHKGIKMINALQVS